MNNRRIGKMGVTLVLGLLSAICGFVAAEIIKESDEAAQPVKVDDPGSEG